MRKTWIILLGVSFSLCLNCKKTNDQSPIKIEIGIGNQNATAEVNTQDILLKYFLTN